MSARHPPGPPKKCPRCIRVVSWGTSGPRPHRCHHGEQCRPERGCPRCAAERESGEAPIFLSTDICSRRNCDHPFSMHKAGGACRCGSCDAFVPPGVHRRPPSPEQMSRGAAVQAIGAIRESMDRNPAAAPSRNATIAAFDDAVRVVSAYVERCDSEECARLVGVLPDLRDVRRRFELATAK